MALESLAGKQIAAFIPSLNEGVDALSPTPAPVHHPTWPRADPARARRRGRRQKSSTATNSSPFHQDDCRGHGDRTDVDSGAEQKLRASYLVGADGPRSKTRELMDIPFDGRGVFSNSITIYFRGDVSKLMVGRNMSVMYIINPALSGFIRLEKDYQSGFLVVNTVGDTSRSPKPPTRPPTPAKQRLFELLRAGIGVPDIPPEIRGRCALALGVGCARGTSGRPRLHCRRRRPSSCRRMAALAAIPALPTRTTSPGNWPWSSRVRPGRRFFPPTIRNASRSANSPSSRPIRVMSRAPRTYLNAKDYEPQVGDFDIELGYLYRSPAIVAESADVPMHDDPHKSCGRTGSRAPHLWIEAAGKRISTLDLFGQGFVLLAAPGGAAWAAAAEGALKNFSGLNFTTYRVGSDVRDPDNQFAAAYGLTELGRGAGAA